MAAKKPHIVIIWGDDIGQTNVPAQHIVGEFLATFREFPPSQEAGSFSLNRVMEKLSEGAIGGSR